MRQYYEQTGFKNKIKNQTKTKQICCISRFRDPILGTLLRRL